MFETILLLNFHTETCEIKEPYSDMRYVILFVKMFHVQVKNYQGIGLGVENKGFVVLQMTKNNIQHLPEHHPVRHVHSTSATSISSKVDGSKTDNGEKKEKSSLEKAKKRRVILRKKPQKS